jgi:hypothetical protein
MQTRIWLPRNRVLRELLDEIHQEKQKSISVQGWFNWTNWMNWFNWMNWMNWMNWWT